MRRMKSWPICMVIWRRVRAMEPVRAICSGSGVVMEIVVETRSSKREVWREEEVSSVMKAVRIQNRIRRCLEWDYLDALGQSMADCEFGHIIPFFS